MSDSCWVQVYVREDQLETFCQASGLCYVTEATIEDGVGVFDLEEVNYGGLNELDNAARAGVVFAGSHGAGDEYGPMRFAGVGGKYEEHCEGYDCTLILYVRENGTIPAANLKALKKFVAFYKEAEAALTAKSLPKPRPKQKRAKS